MPTQDQIRIAQDRAQPRAMQLWWALAPLKSVVRFMQTGAHPDDEISGMLAALAFRDGINISYACSTRGEGGQNDIGNEAGTALGALRTREMEAACDVLGMRMYWHSTHPEDSITDFGFSKSGKETLSRWGYERTLQRFIEIVRSEKPDIICPTFLDVPGQHGHHRAMTEAAHAVIEAAADPDQDVALPPWRVKKLYLPAWSGAGQAYDDDLPPPDATLTVAGTDREPMTGWNWNRIGQQSRTLHRTQGMGRWEPAGSGHDWPLHLAYSDWQGRDDTLWSGLARTVGDLAELPGAEPMASALKSAQADITAAVSAFPEFSNVADHAASAHAAIMDARRSCPTGLVHDVMHLLDAKRDQLGRVLFLASGVEARARTETVFLDAGEATNLTTEIDAGAAVSAQANIEVPTGWLHKGGLLEVASDAPVSDPYRTFYDPIAPQAPRLMVHVQNENADVAVPVAFEAEPVVLPAARVAISPAKALLNTSVDNRSVSLTISDLAPADASVELELPPGWRAQRTDTGFSITAPENVATGTYKITALVNGQPAKTARLIDYGHVPATALIRPAEVDIGVVEVALPAAKVGYVGAGNDRVDAWLSSLGFDVTNLDDSQIASEKSLSEFDTIVVGIFAFRFRQGLLGTLPALHRWTEDGGTLVTLYHRPWDNWDPGTVPPRPLEIGQPSLRWRVTDQNAAVTQIASHPVLSEPNAITEEDWNGWVKERGLYFAKSWDAAYTPLLSMSDPEESPLTGALLVADIGQGRHIHTSLILHHQMEHLVPGAFRLMANFVSPRK